MGLTEMNFMEADSIIDVNESSQLLKISFINFSLKDCYLKNTSLINSMRETNIQIWVVNIEHNIIISSEDS